MRYALVGTGSRAFMYVDAICGTYSAHHELVGLCDTSNVRMDFHHSRLAHKYGIDVPRYGVDRFDDMAAAADVVIVTTVDATHDEYIVRAMDAGAHVLTEKPMTTTAEKAQRILAAIERTGRGLRVGFNYRYAPAYTELRRLVTDGAVGRPLLVDFTWTLDTSHGADYFRRWHREKASSGGLLVHKATHHFDLVNWWIASVPQTVFAMGDLAFYGSGTSDERFGFDLTSHRVLRGLYLDAVEETGYHRDQDVMSHGITIEDTMAVTARYRSGALLSYSLVAYSPWEGLRVAITGDRGRIELDEEHAPRPRQRITRFPMFGEREDVPIPEAAGEHGGGDALLLDDLFNPDPPPDPLGRAASHRDGAASILLGLAANRSIETGQPVRCDELLELA
jgi:predicted dehydrogenase